ncbi:MAG: hypothetical protein AAF801_09860 [Pseudomonadota bacterium]
MRGRIELIPGIGFRLTTNALVRYEEVIGETLFETLEVMEDGKCDMRRFRAIIWAGLEDQTKSLEEAGDLIDEIGLSNLGVKIGEAVRAAFPDAVKQSEASAGNVKGARRPRKKPT